MDPLVAWLVAGVVLIIAEMIGISGIGLLFAGLGALVTGALIQFEFVAAEDRVLQFVIFFAATAFWAIVLWKLVKRLCFGHAGSYNNMIGDMAVIGKDGLAKGKVGEVLWSGTIMRAQLAADSPDSLAAGSDVIITAVNGTVLTVKPKA